MRLATKDLAAIVAFDAKERQRGEWDSRPYGSTTDDGAWDANVRKLSYNTPTPIPANLVGKGPFTRKCLRYNYIVPDRTRDPQKRDVSVCHVAVKLEAKTNRPVVKVVSVVRLADLDRNGKLKIRLRDIGYHHLAGYIVYWDREDYRRHSINAWWLSGAKGEWGDEDYRHHCGASFPWHATVNPEALRDTRYRYCQYAGGHGVGLLDWLVLYRRNPQVELLAKVGLYQLICPQGLAALKERRVFDFAKRLVGTDCANNGCSVKEIVWAANHGSTVADARAHFAFVYELHRHLPRRDSFTYDSKPVKFRLDYERVRRTLAKWGVEVSEYARYLKEAADMGLDLRNEGTLYPPVRDGRKTFMERLERLEAENAARRHREELARQRELRRQQREANAARRAQLEREAEYVRRTMAERFAEIADFQTGVDRVRHLSDFGGSIILAKTQEELRAEGRRMNNCVGSGTYGQGIVMGDTIIVMFKDAKGHSWCDAEISRATWTVRQCYARGNAAAPKEVVAAAKAIAAELKKMNAANRRTKKFPELLKRKVA